MFHQFTQFRGQPPCYPSALELPEILGQPPHQRRTDDVVYHLYVCACCNKVACYNKNQMYGHVAKCPCPTCKQPLRRLGSAPDDDSNESAPTDCGRVVQECQDPLHVGMVKIMRKDYPGLFLDSPALQIASNIARKEELDRSVEHLLKAGDLPRPPPRLP